MSLPAAPGSLDLLRQQQARLRRLVRRLARPDDVDDVEQEVWVAALERPPRAWIALPGWLASTVRNLVAKRRRSWSRRTAREQVAARPESVPSSAELVSRVELEEFLLRCVRELPEPEREVVLLRFFEERPTADIAARLSLGESTVRARLQRALERLRERLDERTGERARWMRVLAPWSVAAAGSTFVAVKSAAVAVAVVVVAGFALVSILGEGAPIASRTFTLDAGTEEPATAEAPLPSRVEVDRPPVESRAASRLGGSTDPDVARFGAPGRLRLAVVDASSRVPLSEVTVRLLSDARFASIERVSHHVDRALSAGRWSMDVLRDGFDPERRDEVEIVAGRTTDLGTIPLSRGRGVIEGRLRCEGIGAETPRCVELRGAGRSPCPHCGLGEECCGYAPDVTIVHADAAGRFRFSGLAAGVYFARPYDERPRLQPTLRIELARDEWRELELTLAAPVTLEFGLADALGASFVGLWASDREEIAEPIHVDLDVDGVKTAFDATPDVEQLRAAIGPPPRLGQPPDEFTMGAFASRGVGRSTQILSWNTRVDRERAADDALLPAVETPFFAHLELACGRLSPSRYYVRELPASRVRLSARCGELVADELDLDLSDRRQHTIRLFFRTREP